MGRKALDKARKGQRQQSRMQKRRSGGYIQYKPVCSTGDQPGNKQEGGWGGGVGGGGGGGWLIWRQKNNKKKAMQGLSRMQAMSG
jgi:hypothetical protein